MKPLSPWSVKGVDDDAREAARNAAQATGLTLGAWIDRAIRKSTGLMPISPNSSEGTTDSTTFSQAWADHRGDSFEVDHSSTPEAEASSSGAGEPAGPTIEPTPDHEDPEAVPTSFDLQVDPEERFGAGLEPVTTPRPRQWPSFTGLRRAGPRTIGATALVLVLGAGLLVYLISFVGADDTDPTTPATDGIPLEVFITIMRLGCFIEH